MLKTIKSPCNSREIQVSAVASLGCGRYTFPYVSHMESSEWAKQADGKNTQKSSMRWQNATPALSAPSLMRLCRSRKTSLGKYSSTSGNLQPSIERESEPQLHGIWDHLSISEQSPLESIAETLPATAWKDLQLPKGKRPAKPCVNGVPGPSAWIWFSKLTWAGKKRQIAKVASRTHGVLHSLSVLNTPNRADTAPVRHAVFLRPYFVRYGRVASSTYNTRKGKTAGRLYSVFKYPTTPLNTGCLNENRGQQS